MTNLIHIARQGRIAALARISGAIMPHSRVYDGGVISFCSVRSRF